MYVSTNAKNEEKNQNISAAITAFSSNQIKGQPLYSV